MTNPSAPSYLAAGPRHPTSQICASIADTIRSGALPISGQSSEKPSPWRMAGSCRVRHVDIRHHFHVRSGKRHRTARPAERDLYKFVRTRPDRRGGLIASNIENQRVQDRLRELAAAREERSARNCTARWAARTRARCPMRWRPRSPPSKHARPPRPKAKLLRNDRDWLGGGRRDWLPAQGRSAVQTLPWSCLILRDQVVIGRGWTGAGGRPHAEAVALEQAGNAGGATICVTLEPCAHRSERGPSCADLIVAARPERLVVGQRDPDARTCGRGIERIEKGGHPRRHDRHPGMPRQPRRVFHATGGRPPISSP